MLGTDSRLTTGLRRFQRTYGLLTSRGGAVCLMYHSIAGSELAPFVDPAWHMTPAVFERQIAWLARHRRPISMDDLADVIARGRDPAVGTVVVSLDDGYLDNLQVAAPILARYGVPAIVYLPTGYIDRGQTQWIDELHTAFVSRTRHRLELAIGSFEIERSAGERAAYGALNRWLIGLTPSARDEVLQRVREQLLPTLAPPRLTMTWEDVRAMVRQYPLMSVGGHGAEHLDLASITPQRADEDIANCADTLRCQLGMNARHFSFPYGRASVTSRASVARAGFESAVCRSDPALDRSSDLLAMGRVDPKICARLFPLRVTPAYQSLHPWLRSRI